MLTGDHITAPPRSGPPTEEVETQGPTTLLVWLSMLVMAFVILMPTRYLPWLTPGIPVRFAQALLIAFTAVAAVALGVTGNLPAASTMRRRIARSWPILAMGAIDLAFLLHAFLGRNQPELVSEMRLRYWLFVGTSMLALPASYFVGLLCRRAGSRRLGIFLAFVTAVSFLVGLAEYAQLAGYPNAVAGWLEALNRAHATQLSMWRIQPGEPLRVQGLETYPALYAFPALITIAWALAATESRRLRAVVGASSLGIIALSGSRTVLVGVFVVIAVWAVSRARQQGLRAWLRRDGAIIGIVVALGAVAVIATLSAPAQNQGAIGRMVDSLQALDGQPGSSEAAAGLGDATNSRVTVWGKAFEQIAEHPLGTGFPYRFSVAGWPHAHSELLERMVWGGPLMLAGFLALLAWLMLCVKTPSAPSFGLLAGTGILVAALGEIVTMEWSLPAIALFIAGASISEEWLDGRGPFASRLGDSSRNAR